MFESKMIPLEDRVSVNCFANLTSFIVLSPSSSYMKRKRARLHFNLTLLVLEISLRDDQVSPPSSPLLRIPTIQIRTYLIG